MPLLRNNMSEYLTNAERSESYCVISRPFSDYTILVDIKQTCYANILEPEASLPVNVMMSYMTPEQRLKLYEFVVQVG